MVAARNTPSMPNWPGPSLAGMNGVQLAGSTYITPKPRNAAITATLIATTTALANADWVMPTSHRPLTAATIRIAGRLTMPAVRTNSPLDQVIGAVASSAGKGTPRVVVRKLTMYPDQPTATVEDANRYSRTRHQPMNQAVNSPKVA